MRIDRRDHADAAIHISSHALDVSGETLDEIFAEHDEDIGHDADRLQQIEHQHRFHDVQLELPCFRRQTNSVVVADHLERDLVYYFGHHWVYFSRHDARTRL